MQRFKGVTMKNSPNLLAVGAKDLNNRLTHDGAQTPHNIIFPNRNQGNFQM